MTYEQRVLAACNRMARRMGCVFVKGERWEQLVAASQQDRPAPTEWR